MKSESARDAGYIIGIFAVISLGFVIAMEDLLARPIFQIFSVAITVMSLIGGGLIIVSWKIK